MLPSEQVSMTAAEGDDGWGEMTSEAIQALLLSNAINSWPYRHPIFRRLYLISFLLFGILILLPAWAVYYVPRSNRPRQSWTVRRCLRVRWSRLLCGLVARCEIDYLGRDLSVDPDPMNLKWSHPITIPPPPPSFLRGHPEEALRQLHASRGSWVPHFIHRLKRGKTGVWGRWNHAEEDLDKVYGFESVKAFWFTGEKSTPDERPAPRNPGDPVMIHFHGGGYICGTAAETDLTSSIAKSMVKHSPIHHVLSVDYRLAPTAPWPLPLLDAITAYHYLVRVQGVYEEDIVIVGDSAGGHLAMALVRWLRDEGAEVGLRMPRGLVLLSPWADVGFTNAWGAEAVKHNRDCDTIEDTFGPFACSLLLRGLPASIMHTSSYLSPASHLLPSQPSGPDSFERFPPTYVVYGDAERLSTSIELLWDRIQLSRRFAEKSGASVPVQDRLLVSPDSVHDFVIFPWMAEEASKAYEDMDIWLRELLSAELPEEVEKEEEEQVVEVLDDSPTGLPIPISPLIVPGSQGRSGSLLEQQQQRRRSTRQQTRESFKSTRSPTMGPTRDDAGLIRLVEDMGEEGINMIGAKFDYEMPKSPEWLAPLTGDLKPTFDLDDDEIPWYELDPPAMDIDGQEYERESRKDR
ncbi:endoplasmic reticulum protein [Kwoniella heveanensis BCC8398]|uniref:Endoplasmic reticulum protein n=1 Tax=Kwoniella heveanensis BCC8398 TaxID=1296120 RepID=A0A1B9GT52_9TREE|nr:endoplasmic reticulum protein [Kwoniella heveanensis BCC8398]